MRNKHSFTRRTGGICPFKDCGQPLIVDVDVNYITNQRGDVIEQSASVKVW